MVNYSCAKDSRTPSSHVKRFGKLYSKMPPAKRRFRPVKTVEEERKMLEESVPKSTQSASKWTFTIFKERRSGKLGESTKTQLLRESCSFAIDKEKVQSLDTKIVNMTAESLNLWLTFALHSVGFFLFFGLSEFAH